jgi:prevent-host-death family protein
MNAVTAIPSAEANRQFSRLLREVGEGGSYTITSHGRPVARLVPADAPARGEGRRALLAVLRAQDAVAIGPVSRDELYER